ncbi:MAG: conserved rane protein of unknown function [Actinomycetia bacterium]|nr:conserved rane protein of unknown function [Actinomycetes bacterium]
MAIRAALWSFGLEASRPARSPPASWPAGSSSWDSWSPGRCPDYRDAERAPTDLAAGLYAFLREAESFERVWGKPDLRALRERLIAVVTTLRSDINTGNTRDCQAAIEDLSDSLLELEESDVPANYVVRLRAEQAGLRKSILRVYHIQREQFLPSAKAMITTIVAVILALLLVTNMGGLAENLITLGFLSFFFLYLLRLLSVIDTPFKVGQERTDDDVSLFLLTEFMVHAQAVGTAAVVAPEDVETHAAELEADAARPDG